jgi:U4/U6.U5 tri-snRNP component SNU23
MAEKSGAYESKAGDTDFRKKWDKEEYAEKARKRDADEKERMQENDERLKQGKSYFSSCLLLCIHANARW